MGIEDLQTSFLKVMDQGLQALLYAKFKSALELTNLNKDTALWPKEVALRKIAEKRSKTTMEFINVWRNRTYPAWDRVRSPLARHGMLMKFKNEEDREQIDLLKAQPIDLEYDFWIWTKDLDKLQRAVETYLFWQFNDPNLNLSYNNLYPIELDLHFGEVEDESPVEELYSKGLYFVSRFPLKVDGWVMLPSSVRTVKRIVITLYDESGDEPVMISQEVLDLSEES